ncbi:MAG: hypothetical protein WBX09_15900 [Terracidiphilus sp.]
MTLDSQQIGIIGRQILTANLLAADLEVAVPIRDRGIDLIVYRDRAEDRVFRACPIQLKTASEAVFGLDTKYKDFGDLRIVFVWNAKEPSKAKLFALTYPEAEAVLEEMKFDQTGSWEKGKYTTTRPSAKLKAILEKRFEVSDPQQWPHRLGMVNPELKSKRPSSS